METENVTFARDVIAGRRKPSASEALKYSGALKGENRFDLARRVLAAAELTGADPKVILKIRQQVANCTYKDEDIQMPHRFFQALDVLRKDCDLDAAENTSTETLGLGGAIYKRLWEYGGQREHLEKSLGYYYKAHALAPKDNGYVAINTAFVLDLLASQETASRDVPPAVPKQRFEQADAIRTKLIDELRGQGQPEDAEECWWYYATLGEAAIGLGRFADAVTWLQEGQKNPPKRWERESTARQLAWLTCVQSDRRGADYDGYHDALQRGLGLSRTAVDSIVLGKVGLALSGGGFRASLFHIGMFAKLAELDVLRHVEVLSGVSGGSIIGAYYYLVLKRELEQKGTLTQQDYIDIVKEVEREFLAGVQTNIRTRIASNFFSGLKMAFVPGYTRTSRAGELYEKKIYSRVDGVKSRTMQDLVVKPAGEKDDFNPKYDNWHRESKVPILVLNATTVNTGHNWQFAAKWMGESPQAISGTIDAIPRLRRMYYDEAPEQFRKIPLGQAVGASACVPGVFEPIVLRRLYPERTARLVDGGVHDNQGLASLIEASCNVILASDASGQMYEEKNPPGGILPVASRTNSILQSRVREAQYNELQSLHRSGAIDGMMFIHLTMDLEAEAISFAGAKDSEEVAHVEPPAKTTYGVDVRVQRQLAAIRTDLDSFSDAEAYGLMMSGYLMTQKALCEDRCAPTLPRNEKPGDWRFLRVKEALTEIGSDDNQRMHRLLKAACKLSFKIWFQSKVLLIVSILLGLAAAVAAGRGLVALWQDGFTLAVTSRQIIIAALAAGGVFAASKLLDKFLHYQKRIGEFLLGLGLATGGLVVSWLHLTVFDQLFLWYGQWKPKPAPSAFADPASPHLPIRKQPEAVQDQPARGWTPVVRR
ncbi:MAG TPA: patatin-like phospholipase family protein, partial [Thermoanaerobaculia bacterium]|nr:patatin-like phospholipase family protein [Thermoanaerobaculia bacterium]